ncbi:hypothetical protein A6F68_01022 [Tsuneonella dongtanensis]|uniref:Phage shock protein B n=1 Tax=Tsuneonella dongtanensis TaxID=692370 RepID=A0A1B2ABS1_9SPHN|nr:hypothetical protein [Tsuneonella dongtanensis]ANY19544.1 hypothetical protein A6F68_01022 [Tsuneonella dongtanensis]
MSFWTAFVVTVAIIAFTAMRIVRYNTEGSRRTLARPPSDDGDKVALRREVEDLRERIKVLERITTETNTTAALETRRVADEIEALRDREHS